MGRKEMGTVLRKEAKWSTDEAKNVWTIEEHKKHPDQLNEGNTIPPRSERYDNGRIQVGFSKRSAVRRAYARVKGETDGRQAT